MQNDGFAETENTNVNSAPGFLVCGDPGSSEQLANLSRRKSGGSDSSATFYWLHIHYTHGQWCCRGSSSSNPAVSFSDRLRSKSFTSGGGTQNAASPRPPSQGQPAGNYHSPCEQVSCPAKLIVLYKITPTFHYNRSLLLKCHHTLKFMNPVFFWFYIRIFTKIWFCFHGERFLCVTVCACACACVLRVPFSHSYASASYQGLLCLIELRSRFPFISQMRRKVFLLLPNIAYKTGQRCFLNFS